MNCMGCIERLIGDMQARDEEVNFPAVVHAPSVAAAVVVYEGMSLCAYHLEITCE